jgi:hypothetical protein
MVTRSLGGSPSVFDGFAVILSFDTPFAEPPSVPLQ